MSFLDELQKNTNKNTRTLNGAVTNDSTLDPNLDYFSLAGAMRNRVNDTRHLFAKAFAADPQTALRTLFYLRDIRGGQGEREIFRAGLQELEDIAPETAAEVVTKNYIGEYGRYDDLFALRKASSLATVAEFVKAQLADDEALHSQSRLHMPDN